MTTTLRADAADLNVLQDKQHVRSSTPHYAGSVSRISPPSDDLAQLLRAINVRSTILCRSHFTAPWGFRVDGSDFAKFHNVLEGAAWLDLDSPTNPTFSRPAPSSYFRAAPDTSCATTRARLCETSRRS